jgi:hypothetical protein
MSLSGTCKDQTGFPLGTVSIRQGQAADVSLGIYQTKMVLVPSLEYERLDKGILDPDTLESEHPHSVRLLFATVNEGVNDHATLAKRPVN